MAFYMDMDSLYQGGVKLNEQAANFRENIDKVSKITDDLVNNAFTSADAVALAQNLRDFRPMLERMAQIVNELGNNCIQSSNKTQQKQDELVDLARRHNVN